LCCGGINIQNFIAVHLSQKDRRNTEGLSQKPPIGPYMRGQITNMVTQIEGVPGSQRDPALTGRKKSFNF
jgi:hypothetical protein